MSTALSNEPRGGCPILKCAYREDAMIKLFVQAAARALLVSGICVIVFDAAAEYPDRPIRYIVPSAAGGGADISARQLTAELASQMKQLFVIDKSISFSIISPRSGRTSPQAECG